MAFRVNYNQQRGDRTRAKEEKKKERLARREEESLKRKSERDGMLSGPEDGAAASGSEPSTTEAPGAPKESE